MAKKKHDKEVSVPENVVDLEWHIPENLTKRYATNFVIRHSKSEFTLYFFDTEPPITLGSEEEIKEKLEKITSVRANCVSSVVVTPDKIPGLIEALQVNYKKYATGTMKEPVQDGENWIPI